MEDFSKSYGRRRAAENLSFCAERASVTALAGLNGAGKTTVLKAVCGIHRADSGRVIVNGIDTALFPEKAALSVGFMGEQNVFPPFLTVYEFLYHEALILCAAQEKKQSERGTRIKNSTQALERVVSLCDLESLADRKIAFLSNGEKKRTALARSLLSDPPILVLDEPASGLDPSQSARMRALIADLGRSKTVLFSTHLIHEMENLCAKIVILHKGHLAAQGSARELCRQTGVQGLENAFLRITEGECPDAS